MSKFIYEENELFVLDNQCQTCKFYNNGEYSKECPKDIVLGLQNQDLRCPKKIKVNPIDAI